MLTIYVQALHNCHEAAKGARKIAASRFLYMLCTSLVLLSITTVPFRNAIHLCYALRPIFNRQSDAFLFLFQVSTQHKLIGNHQRIYHNQRY